jgi:hypothetical protein
MNAAALASMLGAPFGLAVELHYLRDDRDLPFQHPGIAAPRLLAHLFAGHLDPALDVSLRPPHAPSIKCINIYVLASRSSR